MGRITYYREMTPSWSHFICFQESELDRLTSAREAELKFVSEQNDLELSKAKEMASIETTKFKNMVDAIGTTTLAAIANAGPEMQVCLIPHLYSVQLQSFEDFGTFSAC